MKTKILLILVPFLFVSNIESGQYKGRATIELPKRLCTKDNRPKERSLHLRAIEEAKKIAWNNYINTFTREKIDAYNSNKNAFLSKFDEYVDNNYKILFTECDNDTRTYTVVINANINEQQVNASLRDFSSTSQIRSDLVGKSIVAMVIPRKTDVADIFDEKVNKQTETRNSSQTDAVINDDGSSLTSTESTTNRSAITTGGKTTRKATQRTYLIGDLQSAVSQISDVAQPFQMSVRSPSWLDNMISRRLGYEKLYGVISSEFLGNSDHIYGANINPDTQESLVMNIVDLNYERLNKPFVDYLLLGTVDTSVPKIDYDTGSYSADVLVNIQLYRINNDDYAAEIVASVGPEIKTAFGSSDVIAANHALKKAFDEAINSLIYKL